MHKTVSNTFFNLSITFYEGESINHKKKRTLKKQLICYFITDKGLVLNKKLLYGSLRHVKLYTSYGAMS